MKRSRLQTFSRLERKTPLRFQSAKRKAGLSAYRKKSRAVRDQPCLLIGEGRCFGPITPHHTLKAAHGGTDIVPLCQWHNGHIENAVGEERRNYVRLGLIRSQGERYQDGRLVRKKD